MVDELQSYLCVLCCAADVGELLRKQQEVGNAHFPVVSVQLLELQFLEMDHLEPSGDVFPLAPPILPLNRLNGLMVARGHLLLIKPLRVLYFKRAELAYRAGGAEVALRKGNSHMWQPDGSALVQLDQVLSDLIAMDHDDLEGGERTFVPEILYI